MATGRSDANSSEERNWRTGWEVWHEACWLIPANSISCNPAWLAGIERNLISWNDASSWRYSAAAQV